MAWRVVSVENPAKLSTKDNKLLIKQDEAVAIPLEDIDSLVLDNSQIVITLNLISKLAENGVATIICDDKHHPASVILPYSQHSRQNKISTAQLTMSEPMKRQLWMRNITRKIENQAIVMAKLGSDNSGLLHLAKNVRSGDKDNSESLAARLYFSALLEDATRRKPIWHNSALNYGYAIVRGVIARSVAARGLVASQGIFHHSDLNQFNLVDDLIETFRPAVDEYVLTTVAMQHIGNPDDHNLTHNDRRLLIDILNQNVIIKSKRFSIKHACDIVVESFVQAILDEKADSLHLPTIIK